MCFQLSNQLLQVTQHTFLQSESEANICYDVNIKSRFYFLCDIEVALKIV